MFRKLIKNKKAQQTAEYALLISLVVAAVIAMQTYAQRTIQGRIRDASQYMTRETNALGTVNQYEPYYLDTSYDVEKSNTETEVLGKRADDSGLFKKDSESVVTRRNGYDGVDYDAPGLIINNL